jgi:hypothetical protein
MGLLFDDAANDADRTHTAHPLEPENRKPKTENRKLKIKNLKTIY